MRLIKELEKTNQLSEQILGGAARNELRRMTENSAVDWAKKLQLSTAGQLASAKQLSVAQQFVEQMTEQRERWERICEKISIPAVEELSRFQSVIDERLSLARAIDSTQRYAELISNVDRITARFAPVNEAYKQLQNQGAICSELADLARQAVEEAKAVYEGDNETEEPGDWLQRFLFVLTLLGLLADIMTLGNYFSEDAVSHTEFIQAKQQVIDEIHKLGSNLPIAYVGYKVTSIQPLRIRSGAGRDFPIKGRIQSGGTFWVTESAGEWRAGFSFDEDGQQIWGWVYRKNIVRDPTLKIPPIGE